MAEFSLLQAYGVLGYSMAAALGLACAGLGIAYWRAGRDRARSALLALCALLFAAMFAYLALVSAAPPWLNRAIAQPYVRTVALLAALCGWSYLLLTLRHEARGAQRQNRGDA